MPPLWLGRTRCSPATFDTCSQPWMDEVPSYAGGLASLTAPASEQEHNLRSLMATTGPLQHHPTVSADPILACRPQRHAPVPPPDALI